MQSERLTDKVHAGYDPLYLPNLLRGQSPNARILVINTTTAESTSPVSDWVYRNFGLDRYEDILTIETRAAYERQFGGILNGNSVLLTTGSLADLGREYLYPWIRDFRENVLRTVIEDQIPLLGPCFGMAQLARLYGEGYEDTFPKGVRVLGRMPIQTTGQHPIFHGLTNLTGYCHHNGSVPSSLIERYGQEITVHAITRHPETNLVIPALLTFGDGDIVIGSQFHREILDQEAYSFYERRVLNVIDQIFSLPAETLLVAQSYLQSVYDEVLGLSIEELKSLLRSESLEKFNLGHLQQYINFLNQQGESIRNIEWVKGYIESTSLLGDEGYNPNASLLYFDNFLLLALRRIHNFETPLAGVCEVGRLREVAHKEREPLYTYIKDGEYFFVELMGCSATEIQEMHDIYVHGFGDHLPMSHEQHQGMASNGDTIAIRDERGNIIALRAIVYDASSSYPFDPEIRPDHAYQNHTIIINRCRGKGHGEELIRATRMLAQREGKTSILTSVAPENGRNLSFLTRNGYRIIIYSRDHFGEGENRYLLELRLDNSETAYSIDYFTDLIQNNSVAEITNDTIGEMHNEDYYLVCVTDVNVARMLLDNGYIGIRVIRGSYIKKDPNMSYILFNKPE